MFFPYYSKEMTALLECAKAGDMQARVLFIQMEMLQENLSSQSYIWLVDMAENGDFYARNVLYHYLMGHEEISFDWEKMLKWAEEMIAEDPGEAYHMLSGLYAPGMPGFDDVDKCLRYLELGTEAGSNDCAYKLACLAYEFRWDDFPMSRIRAILEKCGLKGAHPAVMKVMVNICVEQNDAEAAVRYSRLWNKEYPDDSESCMFIANFYANGYGVKRDYKIALKYYQKAANLGDEDGMLYVGFMHFVGDGCRVNESRAADYFERALNAGSVNAYSMLAKCYLHGIGVKKNLKRALELLEQGVKKENYACCYLLARCYYEGDIVERDLKCSLELLKDARTFCKGCEIENLGTEIEALDAQCLSELREEEERTLLPSFLEKWNKALAEKDVPTLDNLLTDMVSNYFYHEQLQNCFVDALEQKICSPNLVKKLMNKLRRKADEDSKTALFIARMYDNGRGVRRNLSTAYNYYEKAWRLTADEELALTLYFRLLDGTLKSASSSAFKWLSIVLEMYENSPRVNYLRGLMHSLGRVLRRDKSLAEHYFSRAAEAGFVADSKEDLKALRRGQKSYMECLRLK